MGAIESNSIEFTSRTDTGRVRSSNQDACADFSNASGGRLFVVADGMGGHRGGETASRMAVQVIGEVFQASTTVPEQALQTAFETASARIHAHAQRNPDLAGMGTTAIALLVERSGNAWVAHVGDSRLYRLRGNELEALSADHSFVGELERGGLLSPNEAAVHPRRNQLLRSVGVLPAVQVDIRRLSAVPGDRFLLCTDGLWSLVSDEEIAQVLGREGPDDAARLLLELANARGGTDNVTVQIARIPGEPPSARLVPVDGPPPRPPPRLPSSEKQSWRPSALAVSAALLLAAALLWSLLRLFR
jgi:protein phosphatase